jgi:hypothetical protein
LASADFGVAVVVMASEDHAGGRATVLAGYH